jgi:hypothetical protein
MTFVIPHWPGVWKRIVDMLFPLMALAQQYSLWRLVFTEKVYFFQRSLTRRDSNLKASDCGREIVVSGPVACLSMRCIIMMNGVQTYLLMLGDFKMAQTPGRPRNPKILFAICGARITKQTGNKNVLSRIAKDASHVRKVARACPLQLQKGMHQSQ